MHLAIQVVLPALRGLFDDHRQDEVPDTKESGLLGPPGLMTPREMGHADASHGQRRTERAALKELKAPKRMGAVHGCLSAKGKEMAPQLSPATT